MIKDPDYRYYQRKITIEFFMAISLVLLCLLIHLLMPFDFIATPTLAAILMTIVFCIHSTFGKNPHVEKHSIEVDETKNQLNQALSSLRTDGLIQSIKYGNDHVTVKLSEEKMKSILEKHQQITIH